MLQDEILTLLRSGGGAYLSGEAMSRKLGVSRAAVWKAVDALRREGYAISSGSNRGYRLESAPDTLRAGELSQALAGRLVGSNLACLETVDSTNNEVKRRALAGAADGLAVVAEQQTGGRGRRGRACGRGGPSTFGRIPCRTAVYIRGERHPQLGRAAHLLAQHFGRALFFFSRTFDDQLVVHLKYKPCLRYLLFQPPVYPDHSNFYYIRRASLYRRIHSNTLSCRLHILI